jgi:hypothetical protein
VLRSRIASVNFYPLFSHYHLGKTSLSNELGLDRKYSLIRVIGSMICVTCGASTPNPKFCSKSYAAKFNNRESPKRQRQDFFCQKCGAPARYRRKCCEQCNPMNGADWSTRTLLFARSFLDYHARIRQLARKNYYDSGRPRKCSKCGYSKHLEICHIKPIQDFDEDTPIAVINSLDNLVALCPNCHWEFDNGLLVFST